MGLGIAAIAVALTFIVGPVVLGSFVDIPTVSQLMLMGFGVFLLLIGMVIITITRLYVKASADEAFVRTGMGGARVIIDGGAIVIPVVHQILRVSLRTMRIEVTRAGQDALITRDYLRADVTGEFYLKVPKEPGAVLAAATSLGEGAINQTAVRDLLEQKFVSALRQVAAEMEIADLLVNRAGFIQAVAGHVTTDIQNNGLVLETVTISKLDQTARTAFRSEDNIFDAQGNRKIVEIVAEQRVASENARLGAEQQIGQRTVDTNKVLYEQEVARATAEAEKDRSIRQAQAEAAQKAATVSAEQDRIARTAEIERDRAVQVTAVDREQAVAVANQQREQATQEAEIARDRAVEVAKREQAIAVANKEKDQAEAEAARIAAEIERTKRDQEQQTVAAEATAERARIQAVVGARAAAEQNQVQQETLARVEAFKITTQAEAEQTAAQRRADAVRTEAEAAKDAQRHKAEGATAVALIPVEVQRQEVTVFEARVAVERNQLQNQAEFETIARELQVQLAQIAAGKDVGIAQAQAMGQAIGAANITLYGDPTTLGKVLEAFNTGQRAGVLLEGLNGSAPQGMKDLAGALAAAIVVAAEQKFGIKIPQDQAAELAAMAISKATR